MWTDPRVSGEAAAPGSPGIGPPTAGSLQPGCHQNFAGFSASCALFAFRFEARDRKSFPCLPHSVRFPRREPTCERLSILVVVAENLSRSMRMGTFVKVAEA